MRIFRRLALMLGATPTDQERFFMMIKRAHKSGWDGMPRVEAQAFADLGAKLGYINPDVSKRFANKLQYGHIMLRKDGEWACSTCGGNCGQCGDTSFYGNIGFDFDHMAKHTFPRVS